MDKTLSISLGGFSFVIDENAYSKLNIYLKDIRNSLRGIEGIEDIIEDVEIRIAELFREKLKHREVVSNDDVDLVISIMGHPNQFKVEDEDFETHTTSNSSQSYNYSNVNNSAKRLFRDPDDKVLTGLSAGIAHYFGLDPWAIRAAWIICSILTLIPGGFPVFAVIIFYVILLFFVPIANSTSEKLQMYGKPANIETIKKNVEQASDAVASGSRELSNKLGGFFSFLGKGILYFIGSIILMIGVGLIIGGIALAFTTWTEIPTELFGYLVEDQWMSIATKILGGLLMIIPGVLFIILGIKIFKPIKTSKILIISSIVLWFIALFSIIIISLNTASRFRNSVAFTNSKVLNIPSDTLTVQFKDQNLNGYTFSTMNDLDQLLDDDGNLVIPIDDEVKLVESDNDQFKLEIKYSSKGGSTNEAKRNVEAIFYQHTLDGNVLNLDEFIKIKKDGKFRKQDISITIHVPKNKFAKLKMNNVFVVNRNSEKYYYSPNNNLFFNNGKKIVCLDCNEDNDSEYDVDYNIEDISEGIEIQVEDSSENAKVKIDRNGIRIQSNDGSVGITTQNSNNN